MLNERLRVLEMHSLEVHWLHLASDQATLLHALTGATSSSN